MNKNLSLDKAIDMLMDMELGTLKEYRFLYYEGLQLCKTQAETDEVNWEMGKIDKRIEAIRAAIASLRSVN